jgi:hypothetical protein
MVVIQKSELNVFINCFIYPFHKQVFVAEKIRIKCSSYKPFYTPISQTCSGSPNNENWMVSYRTLFLSIHDILISSLKLFEWKKRNPRYFVLICITITYIVVKSQKLVFTEHRMHKLCNLISNVQLWNVRGHKAKRNSNCNSSKNSPNEQRLKVCWPCLPRQGYCV